MLRQGTMPGQYVLQYYVDRTGRKLKGSIDLDQCEQVGKCVNLSQDKIKSSGRLWSDVRMWEDPVPVHV